VSARGQRRPDATLGANELLPVVHGSSSARPLLLALVPMVSALALLAAGCSGSAPAAGAGETATPPSPPNTPPPAAAGTAPDQRDGLPIAPPDEALKTARAFVKAAVLRTDLERAWAITAPEMREGYTKTKWLTGSIPVVPFPADGFRRAVYEVIHAYERDIMLGVLIVPRQGSGLQPTPFFMHLAPENGRWLVTYWAPEGGSAGIPSKS
jgi:hypothetical protein